MASTSNYRVSEHHTFGTAMASLQWARWAPLAFLAMDRWARWASPVFLAAAAFLSATPARAASGNGLTMTLSSATLTFPNGNPANIATIAALENPITVTVQAGGPNWVMTVIADGDLTFGTDSIPISAISWTSTGSKYVPGTLSKTSQQSVGAGPGGGQTATGQMSFHLKNDWAYAVGRYSQTITFTASAF